MATDTTLEKRTMLQAFKERANPTLFLSSWFKTGPRDIFRTKKCVIDIKRNGRPIAIDVVRGTGGRRINNKTFTTKEYEPPIYDLYNDYNDQELLNRLPGNTEYESIEESVQFMALVVDDQIEVKDMILRAIEKQAADTLLTGSVPLINSETIDYKQKTSHQIVSDPVWSNSGGLPRVDITSACQLISDDAKITIGEYIAIFGTSAWENFIEKNQGPGENFDMKDAQLADIVLPTMNIEGASFHGYASAGSYKLQLWTYPQNYDVPTGFGLPNEGTTVPYIPADKVIIIPPSRFIDLRLVFAGLPKLVDRVDPRLRGIGLTATPSIIAADFDPYGFVDESAVCAKIGVRSAPLVVPTQIDGWVVINTEG